MRVRDAVRFNKSSPVCDSGKRRGLRRVKSSRDHFCAYALVEMLARLCRLQIRATRVYSVVAPDVSGKSSPLLLAHALPANACTKLRLAFTNYERHQGSHEGQSRLIGR